MLTIVIPARELYNEDTNEFINIPQTTLKLEHSLVSISKWEAKYKKPFISKTKDTKTREETIDYVRFMTLTQNVDPIIYYGLTDENVKEIADYVDDPMTASWVSDEEDNKSKSNEAITSELIYWWMTALRIPWEAQKWHLNRLLMLIRIGNKKSQPPKKMSRAAILARNKRLNDERRRKYNTKG